MSDSKSVHLSVLDNSHAFLREAVTEAIAAQNDIRQWQFAIVHVVQSLELSLKSLLQQIHPSFIYENIDNQKHTVGPLHAMERLVSVATVQLTDREKRKIVAAIDLRNQITHFEFELKPEYAAAKFFETLASVVYFQGRHLETEIDSIIDDRELSQLLSIEKSQRELAVKARQRIKEEQIDDEFIWECPNCLEDTFVAQDEIDTCYTCRHTQMVTNCEHCDNHRFEFEMQSFANDLSWACAESGLSELHNDFGYSFTTACPECINGIREDIQQKTQEQHMRRMEEEQQCMDEEASMAQWQHDEEQK